jgi:hypothetical protein
MSVTDYDAFKYKSYIYKITGRQVFSNKFGLNNFNNWYQCKTKFLCYINTNKKCIGKKSIENERSFEHCVIGSTKLYTNDCFWFKMET